MDYNNIKNQSKPNRLNKKTLIIAGIATLLTIIIVLIITILSIHKTPSKEQMQNDLIQQELDDENLTISDFAIYSENKNDNKYTAITSVTYEKDCVKYSEKYLLTYSKYDEWEFYDVEDYDKELWTKRPTAIPNIEEYTKLCQEELKKDSHCYKYDSFVFNEDNSNTDLEAGKVTYAFDVKRDTVIENRSGEIDFSVEFDFDKGEWSIKDISYADSYKIEYNFSHSWSGTLKCLVDSAWADTDDKKVKFSITELKKENTGGAIKGQLIFDNKTYDMNGTISLPEAYDSHTKYDYDVYQITMTGTNEKVCLLEGKLKTDGSLYISINRDYTGDGSSAYLYYKYDIFSGDITML